MAIHNYHDRWMSVEEYLELDRNSEERYEYSDGYVRMLAGGSLNHATIRSNIEFILRGLRRGPCRAWSEVRTYLSETRYVYPDVTVSCDDRDRGKTDIVHHPRVVFEVLSPSTRVYDRGQKSVYYRECPTIQEYVLIDQNQQHVEVFRRGKSNFWVCRTFGPGDEVEILSVDVHFPIEDVYEDLELAES